LIIALDLIDNLREEKFSIENIGSLISYLIQDKVQVNDFAEKFKELLARVIGYYFEIATHQFQQESERCLLDIITDMSESASKLSK
jgi:hypothetical protein